MSRELAVLAEERAFALATIFLSRRNDFTIYRSGEDDIGIDFIVHIQHDNHFTGRVFGVILKYTSTSRNIKKEGFSISTKLLHIETDIPICMMAFTMQSNEGYYKWLYEPVVVEGNARLIPIATNNTITVRVRDLQDLDAEGLDTIAKRVNDWYEARLRSNA